MNVELVDKKKMNGLVAKKEILTEATLLEIGDNSIKVLLVSGYCNGKKITEVTLAKKGDKVNPRQLSFESLRADKSERKLVLVIIDTNAPSVFNYTIKSSAVGERYVICDSDGYYKALRVDVNFNYCVSSTSMGLKTFLDLIGESSLESNFLDNHDRFDCMTLRGKIEELAKSIVKKATESCKKISDVKDNVQAALEAELLPLLEQYGIKIIAVSAHPTVMGDTELNPDEIAENKKRKAEADKKEISTEADVDRHKNRENSTTNKEEASQANELKEIKNEGKVIDAKTEATIQIMQSNTENEIYRGKSVPQLLIELVKEQPDLFLGIIKAVNDNHSGGVLQNGGNKESVALTIIKYLMGFDAATPQKISSNEETSVEALEVKSSTPKIEYEE